MKFCPICETRYDEEILRFCTKDGTPLVDENQPTFTEMPSESIPAEEADFGEETLIRYKPKLPPEPEPQPDLDRSEAPRIVISTNEDKKETARARVVPPYQPPPQPQNNTAKVVLLTILGTLGVLAVALGLFWALRDEEPATNSNINVNTNPPDTNINTGLGNLNNFNFNPNVNTNVNVNANVNINANVNVNANANLKTPTPTRTPTPTPTPDANANTGNTNVNSAPPVNATPSPSPSPTATPQLSPSPSTPPGGRPVNLGVVNGRALNLPKPAYPDAARQARANGQVAVQVLIDEAGNVVSARATTGHPLLRQPAEAAARQSKFNPVVVNNRIVQATGILLYNFIN